MGETGGTQITGGSQVTQETRCTCQGLPPLTMKKLPPALPKAPQTVQQGARRQPSAQIHECPLCKACTIIKDRIARISCSAYTSHVAPLDSVFLRNYRGHIFASGNIHQAHCDSGRLGTVFKSRAAGSDGDYYAVTVPLFMLRLKHSDVIDDSQEMGDLPAFGHG